MDDVITETTSSISIQWCVFRTYIVSMLEMSPFKSVSITLVYTTLNYAPRTRHAAASPWCLLPLPVLAHTWCVVIGVWPQKWPSRHPPDTCFPAAAAYRWAGCTDRSVEGRKALLRGETIWLIVRTCQQVGRAEPPTWRRINLLPAGTSTLYSVAAAAASPPLKGLTCGRSQLSPWPMYGYLHEQTLFFCHTRWRTNVKWATLIQI